MVTPNAFEAEMLTGVEVEGMEDAKDACKIMHGMGPKVVVITSLPSGDDELMMVASDEVGGGEGEVWSVKFPRVGGRYTGTGDLTAALLLAWDHAGEGGGGRMKLVLEKVREMNGLTENIPMKC